MVIVFLLFARHMRQGLLQITRRLKICGS